MGFLIVVCIITLCATMVFSAPNIARQLPIPITQKRNNVVIGYVYYDYARNQNGKSLNRYRSQQPRKELYEPGISYQYYDADMSITRTENLVDDGIKSNAEKDKRKSEKQITDSFLPYGYARKKNENEKQLRN